MTDLSRGPGLLARHAREAVDLAAALRWSARLGLNEGIDNHYSLAVSPGVCLVNPYGRHWSEVRASDMLAIDDDGRILEGPHEVSPTAYFIHTRVHRLRPDLKCLMHTHMPWASALSCLPQAGFPMIQQNCTRFYGQVAFDPDGFDGLALDSSEGERIARRMDGARVLFLGNHGVIVGAASIREAFDDLYFIERSCQLIVLALSSGVKPAVISDAVAEKTMRQLQQGREKSANLHFEAILRVLRAQEPDFES